ncbi:hypothetical protein Goklo_001461 [Gossypium klotzschianum]|uniref:Uncharacterized protein n=1 Tax=Gossypium klotzschianum TaxID=34286 RepID=A0A7J8W0J8_9ROSI|nr:hypothetical protein [Gossypium klotzschianum]
MVRNRKMRTLYCILKLLICWMVMVMVMVMGFLLMIKVTRLHQDWQPP